MSLCVLTVTCLGQCTHIVCVRTHWYGPCALNIELFDERVVRVHLTYHARAADVLVHASNVHNLELEKTHCSLNVDRQLLHCTAYLSSHVTTVVLCVVRVKVSGSAVSTSSLWCPGAARRRTGGCRPATSCSRSTARTSSD